MEKKSKYILLNLEERNGEYEYVHKSVHEIADASQSAIQRFAERFAKTFYGRASEYKEGYLFFGGEVFVENFSWKMVSEEEYTILKKYL